MNNSLLDGLVTVYVTLEVYQGRSITSSKRLCLLSKEITTNHSIVPLMSVYVPPWNITIKDVSLNTETEHLNIKSCPEFISRSSEFEEYIERSKRDGWIVEMISNEEYDASIEDLTEAELDVLNVFNSLTPLEKFEFHRRYDEFKKILFELEALSMRSLVLKDRLNWEFSPLLDKRVIIGFFLLMLVYAIISDNWENLVVIVGFYISFLLIGTNYRKMREAKLREERNKTVSDISIKESEYFCITGIRFDDKKYLFPSNGELNQGTIMEEHLRETRYRVLNRVRRLTQKFNIED